MGQGIAPEQHHPLTRAFSDHDLRRLLDGIAQPIQHAVQQMPSQQDFIERYCKAGEQVWGMRSPVPA